MYSTRGSLRIGCDCATSNGYRCYRRDAGRKCARDLPDPRRILYRRTLFDLVWRQGSGPANEQKRGNTRYRMTKFFIDRPIVAIVISLVTVVVGVVSITILPVSLFPDVVTPQTVVTANYTGADARTIEQAVATPIEQQMSGVDNMNYMYSINANSGDIRLIVNFDIATDPNIDQVLTQLRVSQAQSQLPADVNNYGVTVKKSLSAPFMLVALNSPKGSR